MTQSSESMKETIKAQAAVIEKLREALIYAHDEAASWVEEFTGEDFNAPLINEALAIPTDSTQILDEVRRAERERCASIADVHACGWKKNPGNNPMAGYIASSNIATAIRAI